MATIQPPPATPEPPVAPAPSNFGPRSPSDTIVATLKSSSTTPFPAATAAAALLATLPSASKMRGYVPSRASSALFSLAFGLGGFVISDGDVTNGAGFTSAWSTLYLLVNGTKSVKQLRPWPLVVTGLVGFNALNYGREFFFPSGPVDFDVNNLN